MRKLLIIVGAVALLVGVAAVSYGQFSLFAADRKVVALTHKDIDLLEKAEAKVFKQNKTGATAKWDNPKTGRKGTVTLAKMYRKDGQPCRKVRYFIDYQKMQDVTFLAHECKLPDGRWKPQ